MNSFCVLDFILGVLGLQELVDVWLGVFLQFFGLMLNSSCVLPKFPRLSLFR